MRWIFIFILAALRICHQTDFPRIQQGFATAPASEKYSSPALVEEIIFGSNYRAEWGTPVTMPVFHLEKTNFRVVRMGGGQQTTSLELVDDQGREWALRSVDKNVKPSRKIMEKKWAQAIVQDHVSGSYPYAGLSVPDISNAAGVAAGEQRLYFVPDDSAFGEHRSAMANKIFILVNTQSHQQEGVTTAEMLPFLQSGKLFYVDQREYLKARLVDWLIADWDRHDDQWRWIHKVTDSGIAFNIVPRDRDQAFFRSNGLLVKFIALVHMPQLDKFNNSARGIRKLSNKTMPSDKQFTNQLKKEDWEAIIKEFQKNITDDVIETAIKKQPPEIFAIRGRQLIKKLKSRRDGLYKHVMKYYNILKEE